MTSGTASVDVCETGPFRASLGRLIVRWRADTRGTTSIEYGLIALIIAVGLIATLQTFPTSLNAIFSNVNTNLAN